MKLTPQDAPFVMLNGSAALLAGIGVVVLV